MEEPFGNGMIMRMRENRLYTRNLVRGNRVYGEKLLDIGGTEFREWIPGRSKLSAYYVLRGTSFPFRKDSRVLYLGAASGTTASHVSDLVPDGAVYCVEFSRRTFRDLVTVCAGRGNMVPLLADATDPESFAFAVDRADVVYQDVAQKGQAEIFAKNMDRFSSNAGFLCVKARSENAAAHPAEIFTGSVRSLENRGFEVTGTKRLEPYEKDHMMITVRRR